MVENRYPKVDVVTVTPARVAVLEHRGDPRLIGHSLRKFIAWRRQNDLPPSASSTFNILYDDPNAAEPDKFRLDLCVSMTGALPHNEIGIIEKTIPGGRCAVLRHRGSDDLLSKSLDFLYRHWLPQSGEELRDFPLYIQRVRFPTSDEEAISDIFLPLR